MSDPLRFTTALVDASGRRADWPALALLGDPVAHSRSAELHEAALREMGRREQYGLVEVSHGNLAAALQAAGEAEVRGLNLTRPHKAAGVELADRVSAEAREIGVANTLVRRDGEWVAHNTDARGLAMALERMAGRHLPDLLRQVAVLGSGGAARAAAHALRALGVRELRVGARRVEAAAWAEALGAKVHPLGELPLEDLSLLVQCTSLGWSPEDPMPVELARTPGSMVLYDVVYAAGGSPLVRAARASGRVAEGGSSMLVAQAALSFAMWFGGLPPLTPMARALGMDWPGP